MTCILSSKVSDKQYHNTEFTHCKFFIAFFLENFIKYVIFLMFNHFQGFFPRVEDFSRSPIMVYRGASNKSKGKETRQWKT